MLSFALPKMNLLQTQLMAGSNYWQKKIKIIVSTDIDTKIIEYKIRVVHFIKSQLTTSANDSMSFLYTENILFQHLLNVPVKEFLIW